MTRSNHNQEGGMNDGANGSELRVDARLVPADCDALDLLIEHGLDLDAAIAAHPQQRDRLQAAHALFGRLDAYDVEAPDESLVDATLARIAHEDAAIAQRMRVGADSELSGNSDALSASRGRWGDFIGLACAAILILSVGIPVVSYMRGKNIDAECGNNQRNLASGIETYVRDNNHMPIAAGFSPDLGGLLSWHDYKSARHLDPLVDGKYCAEGCLSCASDPTEEGYAYQVPTRSSHFAWKNGVRAPAVADRNPLIDLSRRGKLVGVLIINSPEHGGRGQNVLFTDGSIEFLGSPVLLIPGTTELPAHSENIWLPMDRGQHEEGIPSPSEWLGVDIFLTQ